MSNKREKNKYLIKNTIIFAIGNFATKIISFLLVPLYTNVMTTSEYGVVDLLYTVATFLVPLFTFNIIESVLRFSLDKDKNQNKIISIATVICLFTIIVSIITIPILSLFKDYKNYSILFYIYLVTFSISQILLVNFKGKEQLKLYSLGNFLYTLFVAIFNIIFLLGFDMGVGGYFIAYIISNILVSIYGIVFGKVIPDLRKFDFDKKLFKEMIKYSVVLIPTSFMWWIMNFIDRIMITKYLGSAENGIYAVSYKIPTILSVLASIFTQAWLFSAIKEKDSDDNESYTNNVFRFLSFGIIVSADFLLLIIKPFFKIYVANDYYVAWKYVPFLMMGYIFLTLSTFISTSYNVNKDSKGLLYSALVGAICNLVLNIILIPIIGVYGAALATTISYITVFVFRVFNTRKYVKIKVDFKYIYSIAASLLMCVLLYIIKNTFLLITLGIIIISTIMLAYKDTWLPMLYAIMKLINKKKGVAK